MSVRNFKNKADQKRKEDIFFKTLDLQAKIANEYSTAIGDYQDNRKLNIAPVVPKEKTPEELQGDHNLQRKIAFDNLKTVANPIVAQDIVNSIDSIDDFSDIILLNQNWADVLKNLKGKKDITLTFWGPFWTKYKDVFSATGDTGIDDASNKIITSVEDIVENISDLKPGKIDKDFKRPNNFAVGKNFGTNRHYFANVANSYPDNPGTYIIDDTNTFPDKRFHDLFNELTQYNRETILDIVRGNIPVAERGPIADWKRMDPQTLLETTTEFLILKDLYFDKVNLGYGIKKEPKFYSKGSQKIRLHREGNRKIFGKGIQASDRPRYFEFGKHRLHSDSLDKNILNLKYKSLTSIQKVPIQSISSDLKSFIRDVVDTGKINKLVFNKLPKQDKDLFYKIAKISDLPLDFEYQDETKEQLERFHLVKGQILAGNNNPEVLKEMQYLIIKFVNEGLLPKQESTNLLYQISVLS